MTKDDLEKKITVLLHKEFHNAEERVIEKLKLEGLTQGQRAKGMVAYLGCVAIQYYKIDHGLEKECDSVGYQ